MISAAKVKALIKGRFNVAFSDIEELAYPVLRHRIKLTFEAAAERVSADQIVKMIVDDVMYKCGLAEKVWQYFIAVPDIKSVGVKDESRYEGWPAIIRAVNTKDAMTATIEEIPYAVLHKIVNRITTEVEGINRVLYDLSPKPTGTIEWE